MKQEETQPGYGGNDDIGKSMEDTVPIPRPPLNAASEQEDPEYHSPLNPSKRIGYAIVGIGNLSMGQILPAFAQCKYSKVTALVSGHRQKAEKVASQYGIPEENIYDYQNFDSIKDNPDVDVVYVVLPNNMHHEFTIRAAQAGKHVLCEKPMANSVKDCQEMIDACEVANKKLMIGYRIQYEPHNRLAMEWVRSKEFGAVKIIDMFNGQNIGDPDQWRLKKELSGGGALVDIGIYCINTCRYLLGEEPESVLATQCSSNDKRFREVEEALLFQLTFPSGVHVNCTTTYGTHTCRRYRCYADQGGWFGLDPAFEYKGLQMEVSKSDGKLECKQQPSMPEENQFALEIDHLSHCILHDKTPFTPGEEGLQDKRIIDAIYESAQTNKLVYLAKFSGTDTFRGTKPQS